MLSSMRSALLLVCVWERLDLTNMLNLSSSLSPGSHEQTGPRMGLEEEGGWWWAIAVCLQHFSLFLVHLGSSRQAWAEA